MQKYYTALNIVDNNFVGTVYESSSNIAVFTTQPHASQIKAMDEVNAFLDKSNNTGFQRSKPETIVNTVHGKVVSTPGRSCCGRR
jgi:hypothetical protein